MTGVPVQTGIAGVPAEPFVVSFGMVGPHADNGPDFRAALERLRDRMLGLAENHRREGWLGWDSWSLLRVTPDRRQRSWTSKNGEIDESRWREAVDGVPERFDHVLLSSGIWGQLSLGAPSHPVFGRPTRAITSWVECPTAGVDEASGVLLEQLLETAGVPGVETGFVHVDSIPDPYKTVVAHESRLNDDRFNVEVHGYYWAVLLSGGHLERLGGAARVRREAPCVRVEPVGVGGGEGLLCVLTESPLELDAERVVKWREFLLPVLQAGYPSGWEEIGERGMALQRPVWLFEGDPVPRLTRIQLAFRERETDLLPVEWSPWAEDPERPTCWLYPGPGFDRERHPGVVNAVINAWFVTGTRGKLLEVEGQLHGTTAATWDTDDDGAEALVWQVETGTCDPVRAITRLVAALSELASVLGDGTLDRLVVG